MPRKKVDAIESPRNSRKSISLTLQNEENMVKCNSTVKKKKQCAPRSRKKEVTSSTIVAPVQPVKETDSPAALSSKKPQKKTSTTKRTRNSKKKTLLTERNMNVNNAKRDIAVKKRKICVRRSSGKKEMSDLSSVVDPFEYIASPAASCSKKPRKKVITRKSPRNLKAKKMLAVRNANENNEKSDSTVKKKKPCSKRSGIRKVAGPSLVALPLQYVIEITTPTASSSKTPRRKLLKTKSPRTPRKRKLPTMQRYHENNEERDSNMKRQKDCDLQSGDREDVVENVFSAEVALVKKNGSTAAASANSKSDYEVRETKCMICLELEESYPMCTAMSCGHTFHSLCLQTWFQVKESCPVCNPEISANDDAPNTEIGDIDQSNDMNRCVSQFDDMKKGHNELQHIDSAVNELKKLNEDINEFLMRCVICMGTSRSLRFGDSRDQISDFELMPCGHDVHTACSQTSSGAKEVCPVCTENSNIEDDSIYEFPEEVRCVICLDTIESSNFEYISCCHSFHHQCIQTWFTVRQGEICPICMVSSSSNADEDDALYGFLENVRCTICMDIEESSEFQRFKCRHSFHTMCAQSWFQENSYCPTCMRNISPDSTDTDDEEDVRCVICVDTEESAVFEFLSCCHSFHSVCLQSWLKKGKSCPICNTLILDTSNTVENVGCAAACN